MSSPQRSEVLNLYEGGWSEDGSRSDGYLDEYEYLSSDDVDTDSDGSSHCESDFTALEDAGDHMPDDHGGPEDDAQMCHRPCPRCPARQLVWESKKPGETVWTDDMHHLYLDLIEAAFVRSLYEGAACCGHGDYHCDTPGRGRWPAEDVECVCGRESDEEEVESNICEPERQIGGATTLALPVSDHRKRHRIDYDDGLTDGENPPNRRRSSEKGRCTQQTFGGNVPEKWASGHAGGLPAEEFGSHGGSLQRILASGIEEDQVVPSVGEAGNTAPNAG